MKTVHFDSRINDLEGEDLDEFVRLARKAHAQAGADCKRVYEELSEVYLANTSGFATQPYARRMK